MAIRLPETIEKRLDRLAEQTGRTKTYYAREAILRHLEDLEDIYAVEKRLADMRSGKSGTVPLGSVSNAEAKPARKAAIQKPRRPKSASRSSNAKGGAAEFSHAEEQARLHANADRFIGIISGDDPTRSQRVRELVRQRLSERDGR